MLTSKEIRKKYLDFFASKGHAVLPSAPLVPENDPTTLFTGSGMQPMVPFLLGQKHPSGTRLADSQKCFRSQDIDEVGDNRHTVFFEMLGNWSLGDYFKEEQISWMWEFLTKELDLNPHQLYFTCFRGNEALGIPKDTESAELWQKLYKEAGIDAPIADFPERDGMQNSRIFYYDETKNWWSRSGVPKKMPEGEPGGPDTEMFWDFGTELKLHENSPFKDEPCHVNCDCGRFMEIGNNVFMQYKKTANGFEQLPQKNVDFGGGLERMAAAVLNHQDVFRVDLFDGVRHKLQDVSGKKYGGNPDETYAFRVVMDHLRAATFLIADGVFPSNKDQGYFVRRLIRRAVRFAHRLGVSEAFCVSIAEAVIAEYAEAYPYLLEKKDSIFTELKKEEDKFRRTLSQGLKIFEDKTAGLAAGASIPTNDVFDLYQSYGFPIELTEELAKEKGLLLDRAAFDAERKKHQELSRAGAEQKFAGGLADHSEMSTRYHTATHLLHATLQRVLGPHALQRGSNITQERMRFDFVHPQKMTPEELKQTEDLVNAAIQKNYEVTWQEMPFEKAKELGVIGLFEDKYQPVIKVYTVGDPNEKSYADPSSATYSREVCGGPHVERTGTIGKFKIVKEEAVSAGVRRIKAIVE